MGAVSKVAGFIFHVTCFYLFREAERGVWFVAAEAIWCALNIIAVTRTRPGTCAFSHFTPLPTDPDPEHVQWLNHVISRMWAPINRSLQRVFREELADLLKKEIKDSISLTFDFVKLDLGTVPFSVERISADFKESSDKNEVCLDLDVVYNGDAEFVVRLGYIQAGT